MIKIPPGKTTLKYLEARYLQGIYNTPIYKNRIMNSTINYAIFVYKYDIKLCSNVTRR
jgi:hypothetical protein